MFEFLTIVSEKIPSGLTSSSRVSINLAHKWTRLASLPGLEVTCWKAAASEIKSCNGNDNDILAMFFYCQILLRVVGVHV